MFIVDIDVLSFSDDTLIQINDFCADLQTGGAVWSMKLKATPPGGPYAVRATVAGQSIEIKDVLFGDVWLCGGQSNMQFGIGEVWHEKIHSIITVELPTEAPSSDQHISLVASDQACIMFFVLILRDMFTFN